MTSYQKKVLIEDLVIAFSWFIGMMLVFAFVLGSIDPMSWSEGAIGAMMTFVLVGTGITLGMKHSK